MSIKSLFGNSFKNYESASVDVESPAFINNEVKDREVYLPPIDFASASNFVNYGLAELYYKNSIARIYNDYPYDGSKAEITAFNISSSYLDRWMLDTKYPKTTGYVELGKSLNYGSITDGYAITTVPEYIRVWGGVHTSSAGMIGKPLSETFDTSGKFDWNLNRTQNWRINPVSGSTIEFWLKKPSMNPTYTNREVILDLWNGELSSSVDYGRLTLELTGGSGACFQATLQSGSAGFITASICTATVTTSSLANWHHYTVSFQSASTGITTRFYVDGKLNLSGTYGTGIKEVPGLINGYVGAFQAAPSSSADLFDGINMVGAAKLSASMDEFRFWKTRRTSRQIELNWFNQVGGGANTDPNTTDLGVYFKFNEGITGNPSIDNTVLDYSGRIANGHWQGYSATRARFTGSAFVLSDLGITESANPIIYSSHPEVQSLISEMQTSGSNYDNSTGNSLYYSMPHWIVEEDEAGAENLKKVTQILSSYFDTLSAQITALSSLKNKGYIQKDYKPLPFAMELLKDKGFISEDILINSNILEMFANIDPNTTQFEDNINKIKNLIYINIYNNLEAIYKSKGTEKSIRNLIRCFGIDDEIVKLNVYTDGGTHYFSDKAKGTSVKKKYIDFNNPDYFSSTIYQTSSVNNDLTYISGTVDWYNSDQKSGSFTIETDIVIPYKKDPDENGYFDTPFLSSSIFGFNEAVEGSPHDYTWATSQTASLNVYLVKDELNSRNAKFVIRNQNLDTPIYLESDWIQDIYSNQHWNLAVRVKLDTYPYVGGIFGETAQPSGSISFYAVNSNFGEIENSVSLTSSFSNLTASYYISAPKRVYAGAYYTNFTGSIIDKSDMQIGSVRSWFDYINDAAILEHNKDPMNYGNHKAVREGNIFLIPNKKIPAQDLTVFNWDFDTVTGSTVSGDFLVDDITSGSSDTIYGWVDNIIRREYKGKGMSFGASKTSFIENEFLYAQKKELPEIAYTNDNIYIKGEREILFSRDEDVSDNFYLIEKSMNQIVSEEMIKLFSTIQEFSNLMGRPVELYRLDYKRLDKVRQHFFERVEQELDLENFMRYYKWIDESISKMISQLIPATVSFGPAIMDVVESHILERNKYQRRLGLLRTVESTEGAAKGIRALQYNWRVGHAPIPYSPNKNCMWQKERDTRTDIPDREQIRKVIVNEMDVPTKIVSISSSATGEITREVYSDYSLANRNLNLPYTMDIILAKTIHGGINYNKQKDRDFIRSAVAVHGQKGPSGAPRNILGIGIGTGDGIIEKPVCVDVIDPNKKIFYDAEVAVAKFAGASAVLPLETDMSYLYRIKSNLIWPSNIVSGTLNTGYNKLVYDGFRETAIVTNLHSDTVDITNEIPMQGPFTENFVGGSQDRHVELNKYDPNLATVNKIDDDYTRPEAWRLLIGDNPSSPSPDGAMGYVGPDYGGPYPDKERKWAIYYREEKAKRPVNIRNIYTTTASARQGNYNHRYEVVSTVGQLEQRYFLRKAMETTNDFGLIDGEIYRELPATTQYYGLFAQVADASSSPTFGENSLYQKSAVEDLPSPHPNTEATSSRTIITSKFSAPGGPEINTRGYLDITAGEYSVYNNLNYRNLTVRGSGSGEPGRIRAANPDGRRDGLRTLLTQHCGKGGLMPWQTLSYVDSGSLNPVPSYYKQARNTFRTPFLKGYQLGKALYNVPMGASSAYLICENAQGYPSTGPITFSFWINRNGTDSGTIFMATGDLTNLQTIHIYVTSAGKLTVQYNANGIANYHSYQTGEQIKTDKWHYVIIQWTGNWNEEPEIYIDEVLRSLTATEVGTLTGPRRGVTKISLFDKIYPADTANDELQGSLCNFAVWPTFLTAEDRYDLKISQGVPTLPLGSMVDFWLLGKEATIASVAVGGAITDGTIITSAIGKNGLTEVGPMYKGYSPIFIPDAKESTVYNNMNMTSLLPASDFQYSWVWQAVTGSDWLSKQRLRGYAPKSGEMLINDFENGQYAISVPAIDFATISDISCCFDIAPAIEFTWPADGDNQPGGSTTTDIEFKVVSGAPSDADEMRFTKMSGDNGATYSIKYDVCCDAQEYAMVIKGSTTASGGAPYVEKADYDTPTFSTTPRTWISNNGTTAVIPQAGDDQAITIKIIGRCDGLDTELEIKLEGVAWDIS